MQASVYLKALLAAAVALVGSLGTALANGSISPQEWVTAVAATLAALGVVYAVPNAPKGSPGP